MKKVIKYFLLIGIFAFFPSITMGQEISNFGVTLGKSLDEVGIKSCNDTPDKKNCYSFITEGLMEFRDDYFKPAFGVIDIMPPRDKKAIRSSDPVMVFILNFDPKHGEQIYELLFNKYGKPSKLDQSPVKTNMGVEYDNINATWMINGHRISLHKRFKAIDKGRVFVTHKDEFQKFIKDKMKEESDIKKRF